MVQYPAEGRPVQLYDMVQSQLKFSGTIGYTYIIDTTGEVRDRLDRDNIKGHIRDNTTIIVQTG